MLCLECNLSDGLKIAGNNNLFDMVGNTNQSKL